ncbi:5-hydroxytryptamine receptor 1B-like [Paramacrobiotus metropolitanus]|uniref:5-hydroxytryptamine receptor 1B-like n=1 Tax=Paramacrobiotus metropolitanus TaxID=2943436 RepID=UPI002445A8D0|nr:5-hydroxytryptamine receptor 1B-like [Paramacrobiotus metropolitanus]
MNSSIIVPKACNCTSELDITSSRLALACAIYAVALITILSNIVFILSVIPYKKLRTPANILLVSNCVADCLVGIYVLPVAVTLWLMHECWPLEHWLCLWYYASKEHCIAVSVIHMMIISIERYMRLFHSENRFYED